MNFIVNTSFRLLYFFVSVFTVLSVEGKINTDSTSQGTLSIDGRAIMEQPLELSCVWEFYPNQLLTGQQMDSVGVSNFIDMPKWWQNDNENPVVEFASYRLKVFTEPIAEKELALTMPDVYCSYDLWVNGNFIGSNGKVGTSRNSALPQWKPDTYSFKHNNDTLVIIIHISNFYHHRAGISRPILLGSTKQLFEKRSYVETANTLLLGTVGILFFLGAFYFVRKKEIPYLFYALLCVSWIIRAAFSNHYQIVQWFPGIDWFLVVRAEYIGIYLSTLFGFLLLCTLFPKDVNRAFRNLFILTCVCFTLFTILFAPRMFTAYIQFYLGLSSFLLLFILIIVFRAYIKRRQGSLFTLFTAISLAGAFGYVILSFEGLFQLNELLFDLIFIVQFILLLIAISRRLKWIGTDKDDYDKMTFDNYVSK